MRAVDTNVVVRFLVEDHPEQFGRARALLATSTWLPISVLLEAEWVLRRSYRLPPPMIVAAFRMLVGLPNLQVENPGAMSQALDWFEQGMDFADALHLASAGHCNGLATFDRDVIRAAARLNAGNVAEP
jgi:predicted nucleic-acid-binding protein